VNTGVPDQDILGNFLDRAGARPVLVDVGASGKAHAPWQPVAHKSVFVGFDPDNRDLDPALGRAFTAHHIIPKIVTGPDTNGRAPFYLTSFPHCSSMLEPDAQKLEPYIFASLFTVDRRIELETTTLAAAMDQINLPAIDWLKVDTQGCDLSVIMGLDAARRERLLCIEVEPGFTPFYKDEESFFEIHSALLAQGYWLAHLKSQQFARVREATIKAAFGIDVRGIDPAAALFGASPTAAEARYFPSLEQLQRRNAPMRDYAVVWTFAVATGLWGYALEIADAAKTLSAGSQAHDSGLARFMYDSIKATVVGLANQAQRPA
jgi:FkbM family methyltransferase